MKPTVDLIRDIPDDKLRDLLGCNRVAIYKWRRGMEELTQAQRERIEGYWDVLFPPDPKNPDFNHPAFIQCADAFWKDVERDGFEDTYWSWSNSQPCCCVGPRDDEPFCPCAMTTMTAHRFGKVAPREDANG